MGVWSIGAMVAPAVGPFLGGYLVDEVSWRSIFYINLPVGAVAIRRTIDLSAGKALGLARRFDLIGFISFSAFLAPLLIALAQGQREDGIPITSSLASASACWGWLPLLALASW